MLIIEDKVPFLKVESGIPEPKVNKYSMYQELAEKMKVGDSVLCDNKQQATNIYNCLYDLKRKSSRRTMPNGKVRIWRIEGKPAIKSKGK